MNRDDIISMAHQANITWATSGSPIADKLELFAALVAAAEREACAKLCELVTRDGAPTAYECAAAIQARGDE